MSLTTQSHAFGSELVSSKHSPLDSVWEVWTYDVWGNARDGYDVNDRRCQTRHHALTLSPTVHNEGTPHEFVSHYPTDAQIRATFEEWYGLGRVRIEIEDAGDSTVYYVKRKRDGYPIGEMIRVSPTRE